MLRLERGASIDACLLRRVVPGLFLAWRWDHAQGTSVIPLLALGAGRDPTHSVGCDLKRVVHCTYFHIQRRWVSEKYEWRKEKKRSECNSLEMAARSWH